jgi:hypothetical protein
VFLVAVPVKVPKEEKQVVKIEHEEAPMKMNPDMMIPPPNHVVLPSMQQTNVPPPNMFHHPPPPLAQPYPPPLMATAHQPPPFHFSHYVMPHQPPTIPGQAPYFKPPYYEK